MIFMKLFASFVDKKWLIQSWPKYDFSLEILYRVLHLISIMEYLKANACCVANCWEFCSSLGTFLFKDSKSANATYGWG